MFPALKSYFLSQKGIPKVIESFFTHDFGEICFWFAHSLMSLFHGRMEKIEKESNSIVDVLSIIDEICESLQKRIEEKFLPLRVKSELSKLCNEGKESLCTNFVDKLMDIYKTTLEYLNTWTEVFTELRVFEWLDFKDGNAITYRQVEKCVEYLSSRNVSIDDSKLFDQYINLKNFIERKEGDTEFFRQNIKGKLCDFFNANTNIETFSEILKIAQYYLAIPAHNANCERVFSFMNSQWTKERNRLTLGHIRNMMFVQFNFKRFTCIDFHKYLLKVENKSLLRKIGSVEKYDFKQKKDE